MERGLRSAVHGFAPLRRRQRVTAVVCAVREDYRRAQANQLENGNECVIGI
jgi:hypothetical protein